MNHESGKLPSGSSCLPLRRMARRASAGPAWAMRWQRMGHMLLLGGALLTASGAFGATASAQARARTPAAQGRQRAELEDQLRQRMGATVKQELRLTDTQVARLQTANQRVDARRRPLVQRERQLRLTLRAQLVRGEAADESAVASALDELLTVQRRRMELIEAEQRELAGFLTPVQRARYLALQENWRRRIEAQLAKDRGRAVAPGRRGSPPPG